jgi:hypothetical protein
VNTTILSGYRLIPVRLKIGIAPEAAEECPSNSRLKSQVGAPILDP